MLEATRPVSNYIYICNYCSYIIYIYYNIQKWRQVACLKVFEATHPGSTVDALNHPNQYFLDSVRHYEAKAAAEVRSPTGPPPPPQPGPK